MIQSWLYFLLAVLAFLVLCEFVGAVKNAAYSLIRIANSYEIWAMSVAPQEEPEDGDVLAEFTRRMLGETEPSPNQNAS